MESAPLIEVVGVQGQAARNAELDDDSPMKATSLPEPSGYKLLIALPNPDEKTEGGIIKSATTLNQEEVSSICGFVLDLGPDAYADEKKFPNGPYCKVGEWVMFRAYSGTRFTVAGKEMRLINDDTVEAVVQDPRLILKA
jgi:co-chaperonin GroES (HSP10)